jgi:hypothetical protein
MFFFEKKKQKTFAHWRTSAGQARVSDSRVFCFFFSKNKSFSSATPVARDTI